MNGKIITGINSAITSITGMPTLYEENKGGKPTLLTPWMRTTIIPNEPVQTSYGYDRQLRFTGLIQLDYFQPSNTSSDIANIDTIVDWFNGKDNRFLTSDGLPILIPLAWRGTATSGTDWYKVPIFIRYETYN